MLANRMRMGGRHPKIVDTAAATATATSLTISKPAALASGMLLYGAMGVDAVTTWSGASGWTQRAQQPTYRPSLRIATKTAGGSEPSSYTFSQSGGSNQEAGHILAIDHGAYDTVGSWVEAVGPSSLSVPGVTMSKGGLLLVSIGIQNTAATVSSDDGMELVAETANSTRARVVTFAKRVGAGPTGSHSFTVTGGSSGIGGVAVGVVTA